MSTKHKKPLISKVVLLFLLFFCVICFILLYPTEKTTQVHTPYNIAWNDALTARPHLSETPQFMKIEEFPPLSTQQTQLLDQLLTEYDKYTTKVRNGEIEFSVTLYIKSSSVPVNFFVELWEATKNLLNPPNEMTTEKHEEYIVIGEWDITYRFDHDIEFFDIKAYKKREMDKRMILTYTQDGHAQSDIWRRTHHQFLRHGKQTLYIRDGAVWKQYNKWKNSLSIMTHVPHFDERYNPYWWLLGYPADFTTFIGSHKTTDIKTVENDGNTQVYLQLYHTEHVKTTYRAITLELLMHPQTGIHPIRILIGTRTAAMEPEIKEEWLGPPKPVKGKYFYTESINFQNLTSELTQYDPGIWLPETVTEQPIGGETLSRLYPDLSRNEYPMIMSEASLPSDWFNEKIENPPHWKRIMKVKRAAFNLPDLQMPDFSPKSKHR
ncbi:hypothetical protein JT359_07705 [Candidatus Poribacteria bacterium]|nr:hypothetical protein [Candidatus Poribacteria bacterium]